MLHFLEFPAFVTWSIILLEGSQLGAYFLHGYLPSCLAHLSSFTCFGGVSRWPECFGIRRTAGRAESTAPEVRGGYRKSTDTHAATANLKRARNQRHLNLPAILGQELRLGVLNIGLRRAAPDSIVPDRTQARRSTSSPRARP